MSDEGCFESLASYWGLRLWRRPLSADERAEVAQLGVSAAQALSDVDAGVRWMMVALMNAPHFLYQVEVGEEGTDGGRKLSAYELVTRLSIFQSVPDAEPSLAFRQGLTQ